MPILRLDKRTLILGLIVFLVALTIRIWHITSANYLDHNGDSYHHWLTSYLTATHGYVHTDYKGNNLNIAWLPLYHYMIAILMNTFKVYNLNVQHGFNILLGSLTCLIVFVLARHFNSLEVGFAAGLALAVQPWFVEISTLGVSEIAAIFLLMVGIYLFSRRKITVAAIPVALAMLIRYEAWVFALPMVIVGVVQKRVSRGQFVSYSLVCLAVVIGWSLNSWIQTGQLTSWYTIQSMTVMWDRLFTSHVGGALEYVGLLIEATSGMFLVGLLVGLLRSDRDARMLFFLELTYLLIVIFQFFRGTAPFQVRFLSYLFPLTAALSPGAVRFLSRILRRSDRKTALSILFLAIIVVFPLWHQFWIIAPTTDQTRLDRHVAAELVAGELLGRIHVEGNILCDSPTIIYYSQLDPDKFYSTNNLEWYKQTWNKSQLAAWMSERDIRYLVWQNVSYSASWWLFPEFSNGGELALPQITFKMIVSTNTDFGPIYIYHVETLLTGNQIMRLNYANSQ